MISDLFSNANPNPLPNFFKKCFCYLDVESMHTFFFISLSNIEVGSCTKTFSKVVEDP